MGTRDDIKQITRALQCACQNNESNVALLNNISTTLVQSNWINIVGNSVNSTYDANNNVTIAEYYTGSTLVFTQTFTYDANNNCINITTT
jgi:hypothetical protein